MCKINQNNSKKLSNIVFYFTVLARHQLRSCDIMTCRATDRTQLTTSHLLLLVDSTHVKHVANLPCVCLITVWHSSSVLDTINEVNLHLAWLVLRWVSMTEFNSQCQTFISICNEPPRPTQPSIPPGSVNEDQCWLGRKRQVWFIPLEMNAGCAGKTVRSLENACHT